jgi:iron complex outermembrane receptor protein
MHAVRWWALALALLLSGPNWCLGAGTEGVSQDSFRDFEDLSLESILDVKVVTVARHEQGLLDAPNAVTVIRAEEIRAFGYQTVAEAVRGLAGIHVTDDRNYEYVGIRGFAPPGDYNSRILVLVDGHALNDILWSYAGLGTDQVVDLSIVDRIEILRGPGSALYGTAAIFGIINIITRRPGEARQTDFAATAGSYGRFQGVISTRGPSGSGVRTLISTSMMDLDGPDLYYPEFHAKGGDGWIRDLDGDRYRRFFGSAYAGPLAVRAVFSSREKDIPTAPWGTIIGDRETVSTDQVAFVDAVVERPLHPRLGATGRAYVHSALYLGTWPRIPEDSTGARERYVDSERNEGLSLGMEGRLDWQPHPRHRILAGAEARRDHYSLRFVSSAPASGYRETTLELHKWSNLHSAYLQEEAQVSRRVAATLGCHYDSYPTFGGKLTPRLGLVVEVTKTGRLKGLYGEGFKSPSYGEYIYVDDNTQIANPELQPERLRSVEVIAEQTWSPTSWSRLSAHAGKVSDLIELTGVGDGVVQYQNAGRASLRGLELETRLRVAGGPDLTAQVTRQEVRTLDPHEWASNSPRWLAGLTLRHRLGSPRGAIALEARYVGARRGLHEGAEIPAYAVVDANLILPLRAHVWALALKVRNLGDHRHSDPGSEEHPMAFIPQNGRTWLLSLVRTGESRSDERP